MQLEPGTKLGHYEIISLINTGGMGEVYEARDPRLDRRVALKVFGERRSHRARTHDVAKCTVERRRGERPQTGHSSGCEGSLADQGNQVSTNMSSSAQTKVDAERRYLALLNCIDQGFCTGLLGAGLRRWRQKRT